MKIANKKTWNILAIFALLLSLITPGFVFANEEDLTEPTKTGTLTIHKYELEEDDMPGKDDENKDPSSTLPGKGNEDAEPVEGVKYLVQQTHKLMYKENGQEVWIEVEDAGKIEYVTDADGKIEIKDMELGRYLVKEVEGPSHIIINEDEFYVDIPTTYEEEGVEKHNYDVHIYPKNEIIRHDGGIIKKGENGDLLEGVVFELYKDVNEDENGEPTWELEDTITTDENGEINLVGIGQGDYKLVEKETVEGYALNTRPIYFTVSEEGISFEEIYLGEDGNEVPFVVNKTTGEGEDETTVTEVYNYEEPEIEKTVESKSGASQVEDEDGNLVDNKDEDGNWLDSDHKVDRDEVYQYEITVTLPGDIQEYTVLKVTDTLDNRLTYVTEIPEEQKGDFPNNWNGWDVEGTSKDNIEFKFDEESNTLTWEVIDKTLLEPNSDLTFIFTAKIDSNVEWDRIPNDAQLDFDNDNGWYTEKDPEDPEEPPTTPPTTPPVIVEPKEGGFEVIKVKKGNENIKLDGAVFKLTYDKEGNEIVNTEDFAFEDEDEVKHNVVKVNGESFTGELDNLVSGSLEEGTFTVEGLTPGTYYLHEIKAPVVDGEEYRLLTKPIEIEIVDNRFEKLPVTVENSKSGWDLPSTGGIGTVIFTVLGLTLMGGALLASRRRKEETA